jgi:hypothetical protein
VDARRHLIAVEPLAQYALSVLGEGVSLTGLTGACGLGARER